MSEPLGSFCLVLHAHLPYVLGHGTWPHGAQMLYDAVTDTYIPLLWTLRKLAREGVRPALTISFSPVLLEQFADERFREWYPAALGERIYFAGENEREFSARGDGHLAWLARCWRERLEAIRAAFEDLGRDLLSGYRDLHHAGLIQLITSAATHGYLPLLREDGSIQLQIKQAVACFRRHIGDWPRGIWLPECGYRPRCHWAPPSHLAPPQTPWPRKGIEEFLADNGIDFCFVDTHMLSGPVAPAEVEWHDTLGKLWGRLRQIREPMRYDGPRTPYAPYFIASWVQDLPAVAAFIRDPTTGLRVWSARHGYPGDFDYLEFHKKHIPGDLRYWRVTDASGDLASKDVYVPEWAENKAREHAGNFLWLVKETLRWAPHDGRRPVLCAPFDAELFGHWWHEGPLFLEHVLRWMHHDPDIHLATCSDYLAQFPPTEAIELPEGSWGAGGGHWVWDNDRVAWTWPKIWDAELDYLALLRDHGPGHDAPSRTLITQAGRELLLLQASDWQFLITTDGAPDYAAQRFGAHHSDFKHLAQTARRYCRAEWITAEEWDHLGGCQDRDRLFPDLDPEWFARVDRQAQ